MNGYILVITSLFGIVFGIPGPGRTTINTKVHPPGRFRCPVEDIIRTKCMGPKDCLYTNPANCFTYIQCTVDPGARIGTPVVMPCPDGLKWNDKRKGCDGQSNATC